MQRSLAYEAMLKFVFDVASGLTEKQILALTAAVEIAVKEAFLNDVVRKDAEFGIETCKLIWAAASAGTELGQRVTQRAVERGVLPEPDAGIEAACRVLYPDWDNWKLDDYSNVKPKAREVVRRAIEAFDAAR